MSKGLIISLGSINKDIQVRANRWPEPGETLLVKDLLTTGGGKAANRAYFIAKLGAPSVLLGRVGDDSEAGEALRSLEEAGVNLEHVKRLPGQRTGLAMVVVRPDGDKTILLAANANENWESEGSERAEQVLLEAPEGSVLVLDLEAPAAVVKRALEAAKERGFTVIMDPSPTGNLLDKYWTLTDFIAPNLSEAESLVGFEIKNKEDGFRACEAMLKKGVRHAIVKMGSKGYLMMTNEHREHFPAPDVQMVDTTGAGDAFAGAFAFAIWEGQEAKNAFHFAAVASSLAVEAYGSQPAYPDKKTIKNKLAAFHK
jgi:ribokinase